MQPTGSTEQHGPMGLIGTDTLCAYQVALTAADLCNGIVAPPLGYTPAPFTTAFPGTVSIPADLSEQVLQQVCEGLLNQGFQGVFIVNGHRANIEPAQTVAKTLLDDAIRVQSWWDPKSVITLRADMFGSWEGVHATPSGVAVTQALHGEKPKGDASEPAEPLTPKYIQAHAGDKHGPPDAHRSQFPDGRVGSHSVLATPELGRRLLATAAEALAEDFQSFSKARRAAL